MERMIHGYEKIQQCALGAVPPAWTAMKPAEASIPSHDPGGCP